MALIAVPGILLGAAAASSALGFSLARTNPNLAAAIAPLHGPALGAKTELRVQTSRSVDEVDAIKQMAVETLRLAPLDFDAARSLGAIAIGQQKLPYATNIMRLVSKATLREPISHAWMLDQAYLAKDFNEVLRQSDIVIRQQSSMEAAAFPMLNSLVSDGRVLGSLADFLVKDPPWRASFLTHMGEKGQAPSNEFKLFKLLKNSKKPPTTAELRTWFLVHLADTPARKLTSQYLEVAPDGFSNAERFIRNGDFSGTRAAPPFDWSLYVQEGGFAEIDRSPTGDGKALYIEFDSREPITHAFQLLTLPPGRYLFTLRTYALTDLDRGQTGAAFICSNGRQSAPLQRFAFGGIVDQWARMQWEVTIPASCEGPRLQIDSQPATVADAEQLFIDDLQFERVRQP